MMPLPCLPVDSASNCSSHAPRSEIPGEVMIVTLSRPFLAAVPKMIPSTTPGFSSTGTHEAQENPGVVLGIILGTEKAGSRFIAITDPRSKLEQVAESDRFRHVFH